MLLPETPDCRFPGPRALAASDLNIGATGSVTPIPTSRALTRITPALPQPATEPHQLPLQGSGVDPHGILQAPDQVVVRSRTPAVALDAGLEHARGSMVRNQPAEALATLDEVWSGARHTESGWYLRGGSLALLGLPAEASRVAAEGLRHNPSSAANHFLQSLARLALGDLDEATGALTSAARHTPPAALLEVQRALLLAEQGNEDEAQELLRRAGARWPNHPALAYGKAALRAITRPTSAVVSDVGRELAQEVVREVSQEMAHEVAHDVVQEALRQLGRQLLNGSRRQALVDARSLLVSLSAGGTLSATVPATRAHSIRALLGAVVETLKTNGVSPAFRIEAESVGGQWRRAAPADAHDRVAEPALGHTAGLPERDGSTLLNTVRAVTVALREGRLADADAQLRRSAGAMGSNTEVLLRTMIDAARSASGERATGSEIADRAGADARASLPGSPNTVQQVASVADGPALLAPLRLGLALLPNDELGAKQAGVARAAEESARQEQSGAFANGAFANGAFANGAFANGAFANGAFASDAFANAWHDRDRVHQFGAGSTSSLVIAITFVAFAVLSFVSGLQLGGLGLGAAGFWLALRRGKSRSTAPRMRARPQKAQTRR